MQHHVAYVTIDNSDQRSLREISTAVEFYEREKRNVEQEISAIQNEFVKETDKVKRELHRQKLDSKTTDLNQINGQLRPLLIRRTHLREREELFQRVFMYVVGALLFIAICTGAGEAIKYLYKLLF